MHAVALAGSQPTRCKLVFRRSPSPFLPLLTIRSDAQERTFSASGQARRSNLQAAFISQYESCTFQMVMGQHSLALKQFTFPGKDVEASFQSSRLAIPSVQCCRYPFLCLLAIRSSATRSSTSDLTKVRSGLGRVFALQYPSHSLLSNVMELAS